MIALVLVLVIGLHFADPHCHPGYSDYSVDFRLQLVRFQKPHHG
ncbi:MAG: hypothetical protein ABFC42_09175 [Sulfuricella sp.]